MCSFFSLVSDGKGKIMFMDWSWRKDHLQDNNDSHTYIADHFGYIGKDEDRLNKYEYNPLTKEFNVDQVNAHEDDRFEVEKFCNELDFKTVVELLIVKPIIHPFKDRNRTEVTEEDKELLKRWDSVGDSVGDSVRDSVWYSVRDIVGYSVGYSVRDIVGYSVWDSVRDSVGYSVRDIVGYSVRDSVWGYVSSFLDIKYDYDYEANLRLWESGLVPSFDGKTWRLHGGPKAAILYEWIPEKGSEAK